MALGSCDFLSIALSNEWNDENDTIDNQDRGMILHESKAKAPTILVTGFKCICANY